MDAEIELIYLFESTIFFVCLFVGLDIISCWSRLPMNGLANRNVVMIFILEYPRFYFSNPVLF